MKITYLILLLSSLVFVACSDDKDDPATPNAYSFSYMTNDSLIRSSTVLFQVTKTEEEVEVKNEETGVAEAQLVTKSIYKPTTYQSRFLKLCEQTTHISKLKSKYVVDSLPEDCTANIVQARSIGLVDLRAIMLNSTTDSEKITNNKDSDLFLVLPLNLITSAQVAEVSIRALPMNVIFDLATSRVIGFTEKADTTPSSANQAKVDAQDKHNVKNKQKFNQLVEALKKEGLYGKDELSADEIQKIKEIAKHL